MLKNKLTAVLLGVGLTCSALFLSVSPLSASSAHEVGDDVGMAIQAKTVLGAIRALGGDAKLYKDAHGDPHLLIEGKVGEASAVAIYFDDCGSKGCEDLTFYAVFPAAAKVSDSVFNEWNHITSKLRSKAARSRNGEITLSMPVSFLTGADHYKLSMLIGLFFIEVNDMSATINKNR